MIYAPNILESVQYCRKYRKNPAVYVLAIQGLYDDYVETKHCHDQTLNDRGKCLGLPHTGYGPDCRKYSASMIWLLDLNNEWIWISVFALN